jgi:hypothetical protein
MCLPQNMDLANKKYRLPSDIFIDDWENEKGIVR